jgi:SlyX protein
MESRITELEIKICYAEDLVDELNRTVFRQQQQIDTLAREINSLRQQIQSATPQQANSLLDDLPPHY